MYYEYANLQVFYGMNKYISLCQKRFFTYFSCYLSNFTAELDYFCNSV
jgi:hypothetical protein